jgi:DNA-binding CsgD family transcriptional regulator
VLDDLGRRAKRRPLLLALDDIQWLDRASLTLIHHVSVRSDGPPLGIVAAGRTPQPGSALAQLVAGLDGDVSVLGHLGAAAVAELAEVCLGCRPGPRLLGSLDGAGGNPMLIQAVLESLAAQGALVESGGGVELGVSSSPADVDVSALRAISDRLRSLPEPARGVVEVAAVAGREVRVDLLARVLDRPAMEVVRLVGECLGSGVFVERDREVEFRHDLYREAVLANLPASAVQALHVQVAGALGEVGGSVLDVAEHYERGARPGNETAALQVAGAATEVVGAAPVVALRLCEIATKLSARVGNDLAFRVTRVRALAGCGRIAEAELLGRSVLQDDPDPRVELQVNRELALSAFIDGRHADAVRCMRRGVELAAPGPERATATAELAWASMLALDTATARADAEAAIAEGEQVGDLNGVITARAVRCWLDLWACDLAALDEGADELAELLADAPGGPWQAVQPWMAVAAARLDLDRFSDAMAAAAVGRRMAIESGTGWAGPAYDVLTADALARSGRLGEATDLARRVIDDTALIDGFGVEVWARSVLALALLTTGHPGAAAAEIEAAEVALNDGRAQFGLDLLITAKGRLFEHAGESAQAHATYREGWDLMAAIGITHVLPALAPGLVRTAASAHHDRAADEAIVAAVSHTETVAERSRLGSHRLMAAHARALLEPTRAHVDELSELAGTVARPVSCWEAWRDVAVLETRLGRASAAERAAARALGLAATWGGGGSESAPVVTRRPRARFGMGALTPAERRVAALVAEGLTNVQIAAELVVSRRTVDSHVLAAYRKLEVNSRVALTRRMLEGSGP